jgi:hypothetical protein
MPGTLRAIGFGEIADERSLQAILGELASRAHRSADGTLVVQPMQGCSVRLHLDRSDQVDGVTVEFDGPEQTLNVYKVEEESTDRWLARCFTCIDCRPVSPLTVIAYRIPADYEARACYLTRLSGFLDSVEASNAHPGDMALGQPDSSGAMPFIGTLLSVESRLNSFTGASVSVASIALPALVLQATIPATGLEVGQVIQGRGHVFAVFGDRVP